MGTQWRGASGWLAGLACVAACVPTTGAGSAPTQHTPERTTPAAAPSLANAEASPPKWPDAAKAATAFDSTYARFEKAPRFCLSDLGCPHAPAPLPPCDERLRAPGLGSIAARLPAHIGRTLRVSGQLFAENEAATLLVQCDGCCAPIRSAIRLLEQPGSALGLWLDDTRKREAFSCHADATQLCCGFDVTSATGAVGHRVAVEGRLASRGDGADDYVLEAPKLCSLEQPDLSLPAPEAARVRCASVPPGGSVSEAFEAEGLVCGCLEGSARCRRIQATACFLRGSWFEDGARVPVYSSCLERQCAQGRWRWEGTPCSDRPTMLYFGEGSTELDDDQRALLDKTADWLKGAGAEVVVEGYASGAEGALGSKLNQERARGVVESLRAHGIPAERVRLRGGTPAPAGPPLAGGGARVLVGVVDARQSK